jgi:hypothetical protein
MSCQIHMEAKFRANIALRAVWGTYQPPDAG